MSLIENIANNIKVLHKVKSVPTNTSKIGIHLVEGGGVYIVAKDPTNPTLKVVKKIYESSDYYMKGSIDTMLSAQKQLLDNADANLQSQVTAVQQATTTQLSAQKQLLDNADANLQSQVTAVQQTTATHTAEIQNIKDDYVANKGYYNLLGTLQTAYPTPEAGDIAYVANAASTTGYYIHNVVGGAWTATTVEAPTVSAPIADYAEHGYTGPPKTLKEVEDDVKEQVLKVQSLIQYEGALNAVNIEESSSEILNKSRTADAVWDGGVWNTAANRITFFGIEIANLNPKVVITIADGFECGVLFWKNDSYDKFLKGFSWASGVTEWEYTNSDSYIITVGVRRTDDTPISKEDAISAVESFEITTRDNIVNNERIDSIVSDVSANKTKVNYILGEVDFSNKLNEISEEIVNESWSSPNWVSTPTRVAYKGISYKEALYSPIKIKIKDGYQVGVLFWESNNYSASSLIKGFSWKTGETEWISNEDRVANIITIGVSKIDGSAITVEEANDAFDYLYIVTGYSLLDLSEKIDNIKPKTHQYEGTRIDLGGHKFDVNSIFNINTIVDRSTVGIGNNTIQGTAIYGDYLVQGYHDGWIAIVNHRLKTLIATFQLPEAGETTYHTNNINFSKEWIEGNDEFPLMYVSESQGQHRCFVYSLKNNGVTKIQTIKYVGSGYESSGYIDWCLDNESGNIYTFGNTTAVGSSPDNRVMLKKFVLPSILQDEVIFADEDVETTFYNDDIYIYQGQIIRNGKLYAPFGYGNPGGLVVIDLVRKTTDSLLSLTHLFNDEPEGVAIDNDNLIISYQSGAIRKFTF